MESVRSSIRGMESAADWLIWGWHRIKFVAPAYFVLLILAFVTGIRHRRRRTVQRV
jgi:hypothetical protein